MKDVLTQPDIDGKRAKWIAKLIEFDIEVKPTKLVKGLGLAKLRAKENCELMGVNFTCVNSEKLQTLVATKVIQDQNANKSVAKNLCSCGWYSGIIYFQQKLEVPPGLTPNQARALKLNSVKFCIIDKLLYWKDLSRVLLRCLDKEESNQVMHHFHSSTCGGHHYWKTTAHKILRAGYYWPVLFVDVFTFVRACDQCQRFIGKQQLKSLPLRPAIVSGPFQQWGLDFIAEINPSSSG